MHHSLVILLYFTTTYSLDLLGIVDLLGQIILCGRTFSTSLASNCEMPVAPPLSVVTTEKVATHCRVSSGGQNCPLLSTINPYVEILYNYVLLCHFPSLVCKLHVGGLKSAIVEIVTPQKSANAR